MTTPYLEQNPTERAREAKELARLAVVEYMAKHLPPGIPTVLRDHETREEATRADSAAL